MKTFILKTLIFSVYIGGFLSYNYQTFQSFDQLPSTLTYPQISQSSQPLPIPQYSPAPSSNLNLNYPQISNPRMTSNSLMSQLSEKIKAMKFDKLNPSPIIINGGSLAPLHIYHQPLWLPSIVRNSQDEYKELRDLETLNRKIDQEIRIRDPFYRNQNESELFQQKILIGDVHQPEDFQREVVRHDVNGKSSNVYETVGDSRSFFPQFKEKIVDVKEKTQENQSSINNSIFPAFDNKNITDEFQIPEEVFQRSKESLVSPNNSQIVHENKEPNQIIKKYLNVVNIPKCSNKKGYLKLREKDMLEKEVPSVFAVLSKERLTYYLDEKDASSIQGSIELKMIKTPINIIKESPNCFQIVTVNDIQNCSICAAGDKDIAEWLAALTQNIVNCN